MSYGSIYSQSSSRRTNDFYTPPVDDNDYVEIASRNFGRNKRKNKFKYIAYFGLFALAVAGFASFQKSSTMIEESYYQGSPLKSTISNRSILSERIKLDKKTLVTDNESDMRKLFEIFKVEYDRNFEEEEDSIRFEAFKNNLMKIDSLNDANPLALFGINKFADLTEEERFNMRMGEEYASYDNVKSYFDSLTTKGKNNDDGLTDEVSWITDSDCAACRMYPELEKYNLKNIPKSWDWRDYFETPVKSQGYCGSCWTFSAAGDIEGKHFLSTGQVLSLSEQQLVACNQIKGLAEGCNGGYPAVAFEYVAEMGGIVSDKDYPYKAICMGCNGEISGTPTCDKKLLNAALKSHKVAHIGALQMVAFGPEDEKLLAVSMVKNGPISIALNADGMEYYKYGIAQASKDCNPKYLDHAVLIVGIGEEDGTKYWIIKNSWGIEWGEKGYMRAKMGENYCGLSNSATTSVVKDP